MQGLFCEHLDLVHLSVNSLSLIMPLMATHALVGRRILNHTSTEPLNWSRIVKFDAPYYAGVVAMVGFWLSLGNEATPFYNWAIFALSYAPLALCEPIFTYVALKGLKRFQDFSAIRDYTAIAAVEVA